MDIHDDIYIYIVYCRQALNAASAEAYMHLGQFDHFYGSNYQAQCSNILEFWIDCGPGPNIFDITGDNIFQKWENLKAYYNGLRGKQAKSKGNRDSQYYFPIKNQRHDTTFTLAEWKGEFKNTLIELNIIDVVPKGTKRSDCYYKEVCEFHRKPGGALAANSWHKTYARKQGKYHKTNPEHFVCGAFVGSDQHKHMKCVAPRPQYITHNKSTFERHLWMNCPHSVEMSYIRCLMLSNMYLHAQTCSYKNKCIDT